MKVHALLKTFWEMSIDHKLESGCRDACCPVVLTPHTLKPHKVTEVTLNSTGTYSCQSSVQSLIQRENCTEHVLPSLYQFDTG